MSKARIRRITEKDTAVIARISDWDAKGDYFTLVDKDGNLAKNDKGRGIVYKTGMPEREMATVEAYAYLMYWADQECDFKTFSPLNLLTGDFTKGEMMCLGKKFANVIRNWKVWQLINKGCMSVV